MGYVVFENTVHSYSKICTIVITEIKINNFKSVADLTLPLGRFNVLIGSNGAGKSNILEAIAFGAAASADKLDNEFLGSRGIRTSSAQLMKSAFGGDTLLEPIVIGVENYPDLVIEEQSKPILKWIVKNDPAFEETTKEILIGLYTKEIFESELFKALDEEAQKRLLLTSSKLVESTQDVGFFTNRLKSLPDNTVSNLLLKSYYSKIGLADFIIYSPEISSLRKFDEESQIQPLGVKGEGLFKILEIFYENYPAETIDEIRQYLHIIEWFGDFEAVFDRVSGRKSLVVKDRNLPDVSLNQHNVNEGFLFLLFYISLMISKETPAFFAIDNIEASFHPALCEELIKRLVELAKKYNKQVILTTHNPFVLDGLDLNDPEQKLFVVRRDGDGGTVADDIAPIKNSKLSEAWMRGRIGGQPETIN